MEDIEEVSTNLLKVFFFDIDNLKNALTGYRSAMLRVSIKGDLNDTDTLDKLDEDLKNTVILWSDSVRSYVERCQVAIVSLKQLDKNINIKQLEELYNKIIGLFAPNPNDVAAYTFAISKEFVKATIEKILNRLENFNDNFNTQ